MDEIDVPSYFLCPITLELMKDPVTISTGITYDRESIEKWLFSGKNNNTCPVTKQVLQENCDLTPNHTLRRLIQAWCTMNVSYGIERIPTPKPPVERSQIGKLLRDARSPQLQRKCLQRFKTIASENESNRRAMEAAGAVEFLASLVVNDTGREDRTSSYECGGVFGATARPSEEAVSILYNLHISKSRLKALVCGKSEFVESLIRVVQRGSYESRTYAVYLLKSMFEVAEPMQLIHLRQEFFVEIVQFLHERVSYQALKSLLQLLINICPWGRNRVKAVEAGAVPLLIELLLESPEKRVCEMLLLLLDTMCGCAEGRAEFLKHAAGLAIVSKKILRVSQLASERAVRILYSISKSSATPSVVQEMLQMGVVAKLCLVLQLDGGSKTKEKAKEILKLHARSWKISPCMPMSLPSLFPS